MPLYEFICRDCGHVFDKILRVYEGQPVPCVQCDSDKTEKLISAHGGYQGNMGGASTRPRSAGSFRGRKR